MIKLKPLSLILLFAIGQSLAAAPTQDFSKFFGAVKKGDYKAALSSVDDSKIPASFNLLLGSVCNALGDLDTFHLYTFRFDAANGDYATLESEMADYSQKNKSGNLDALIGMLFWEHNNREIAAQYFETALKAEPKNPFALNYSSMLYYENDNAKYLDLATKAIAAKKDYSEAYVNAATAHYLLGDKDKAKAFLIDCLKNTTNPHPNVYPNLMIVTGKDGISLANRRDQYTIEGSNQVDSAALDEIYDVIKTKPEQIKGFVTYFIDSALYGEADYYLAKPQTKSSKLPVDYFKAIIAFLNNDDQAFTTQADLALKSNKVSYQEIFDLAGKFAKIKNSDKSIELYKAALKATPKNQGIYQLYINSDLGGVLVNNDKVDEGLSYLLTAYKLFPKDFITLASLGRAYKAKGMKDEAIKFYDLAIELAEGQDQIDYLNEQKKSLEGE